MPMDSDEEALKLNKITECALRYRGHHKGPEKDNRNQLSGATLCTGPECKHVVRNKKKIPEAQRQHRCTHCGSQFPSKDWSGQFSKHLYNNGTYKCDKKYRHPDGSWQQQAPPPGNAGQPSCNMDRSTAERLCRALCELPGTEGQEAPLVQLSDQVSEYLLAHGFPQKVQQALDEARELEADVKLIFCGHANATPKPSSPASQAAEDAQLATSATFSGEVPHRGTNSSLAVWCSCAMGAHLREFA